MLQIRLPLWKSQKGTSGMFNILGQEFVIYLNEVEKKSNNAPDYEIVIKTAYEKKVIK
jgi:hypothetical protein